MESLRSRWQSCGIVVGMAVGGLDPECNGEMCGRGLLCASIGLTCGVSSDFIGGIMMDGGRGGSRGLCGFVSGDVTSNIVELPTNYQKLPNW